MSFYTCSISLRMENLKIKKGIVKLVKRKVVHLDVIVVIVGMYFIIKDFFIKFTYEKYYYYF